MSKDQKQYQTAIEGFESAIAKLKRAETKSMEFDDVSDSSYIIDAYEKIVEGLEVLRDVCIPFSTVETHLKGKKS